MIVELKDLASVGLVKDIRDELIPSDPMGWTTAQNVRFKNGSISKIPGSTVVISDIPIQPYYFSNLRLGTDNWYFIGGLQKFYLYYNGNYYNITRQTAGVDVNYNCTNDYLWDYTVLNSIPVFNNGVDIPQAWQSAITTTKLTSLPGWNATTTCKEMRSFKAYLVAGDITIGTTRYGNRVYWSGSALPGALPTSWDVTDPASDSGYIELSDTEGNIIDMKVLGDNLIIYKPTATYIMQYVGGNKIFSIKKINSTVGLLCKRALTEVKGQHLVVTNEDVILSDGFNYKSIIDGRLRKYLFANISNTSIDRTFVVHNYIESEVWICVSSSSANIFPTIAYVFNYDNNTWTTRTFSETPLINSSTLDISSLGVYNSYTTTVFNSSVDIFDSSSFNKKSQSLVYCDHLNNRILRLDSNSNTDMDGPMNAIVERTNLKLTEDESVKTIKGIWIKASLGSKSNDTHLQVFVGTQMHKNDPITWSGPYSFDILQDDKIDLFETGRYISIRIKSNTDIDWSLENIDLDVVSSGKW